MISRIVPAVALIAGLIMGGAWMSGTSAGGRERGGLFAGDVDLDATGAAIDAVGAAHRRRPVHERRLHRDALRNRLITGSPHFLHARRSAIRHRGGMTEQLNVDELRDEIRDKYAAVVVTPDAEFHFHTGRQLTRRLGYDQGPVDALPEMAVESFAGVGNPFEQRSIQPGENVVDLGSGAGLDSFLAAVATGPEGRVIGVDMTVDMIEKSSSTARAIGCDNVEFREGYLEDLPIEDEWADVVIANGVINLCPDKEAAFAEAFRIMRPGGTLQFADIANTLPVPEEARRQIDLWTG